MNTRFDGSCTPRIYVGAGICSSPATSSLVEDIRKRAPGWLRLSPWPGRKEWPLALNGLNLDVVIDDWPFVAKMRRAKQGRRKIRVVGQAKLNNILTPLAYDISQASIHCLPWSLHGFALKLKASTGSPLLCVTF